MGREKRLEGLFLPKFWACSYQASLHLGLQRIKNNSVSMMFKTPWLNMLKQVWLQLKLQHEWFRKAVCWERVTVLWTTGIIRVSLQGVPAAEWNQKQHLVGNMCPLVLSWIEAYRRTSLHSYSLNTLQFKCALKCDYHFLCFWKYLLAKWSMGVRLELWELPCTLCHCLIVWPWASSVITLGPCFPALKLVQ